MTLFPNCTRHRTLRSGITVDLTSMSTQGLYVITTSNGYAKIGIATNGRTRLAQLQTGNHEALSLRTHIDLESDGVSAAYFEKVIHEILADNRVRGEWFKISTEQADKAIKIAWAKVKYPALYDRWLRRITGGGVPPACPVCAAHRKQKAEQMRRWRAKHL